MLWPPYPVRIDAELASRVEAEAARRCMPVRELVDELLGTDADWQATAEKIRKQRAA
jgi:hypothetical protein